MLALRLASARSVRLAAPSFASRHHAVGSRFVKTTTNQAGNATALCRTFTRAALQPCVSGGGRLGTMIQPGLRARVMELAPATAGKQSSSVRHFSFARPGFIRRILDRLERIPKWVRISVRVGRTFFIAAAIYNLGKAVGIAEFAANPQQYMHDMSMQIVSQFGPRGAQVLEDALVKGDVEARVCRIMKQVADGAGKTLARLHAAETDPEEKMRLARAMANLSRHWTVVVIKSPVPNAFVHPMLPGVVFFLSALVGPESGFSDEEIAMVCAHELSHALLEHGKEAMEAQAMLLALKMMFLVSLDPTGLLTLFFEVALGPTLKLAFELPHSREHESEADKFGIQFIADSCYDLQKAANFFEKLDKMHRANGGLESDWASTHPHPSNRLSTLKMMIADPTLLALSAECETTKSQLAQAGFWNALKSAGSSSSSSSSSPQPA